MLRKGTLKILAVEASMIFLAITVKGITAENETAHAQRIVVISENTIATDTKEPATPETITADETDSLIYSRDWDADEEEILLKVAMAEAEGESTEGKALVMLVVLNRVWSDEFPDTIAGVIFQDGQFSPISNGRYDEVKPDADCYRALQLIQIDGWDESRGATYFESKSESNWHSEHLTFLFQHGKHYFYKE